MSISSVVTRGYGTWSTVNKLPTWGYGIRAVAVPAPQDGVVSPTMNRVVVGSMNRVVVAGEFSRVVVAFPERVR